MLRKNKLPGQVYYLSSQFEVKTDVSDGRMKELNTRLSCAKRPAWPIWRRKHKIDWLHACVMSWNLCCYDLVELADNSASDSDSVHPVLTGSEVTEAEAEVEEKETLLILLTPIPPSFRLRFRFQFLIYTGSKCSLRFRFRLHFRFRH